MEAITILGALATLVSLAGIIYPFKPFGKRRNAAFALLVCVFAIGVANPKPETDEQSSAPFRASAPDGTRINIPSDPPENEPPESQPVSQLVVDTAQVFTRDDIVGQWRNILTNPADKNTVSRRYMRHSFMEDGELVVENEEDSPTRSNWQFDNGIFVVTRTSGTSEFVEHYKLVSYDVLEKIRFKSVVKGEPLADYNPKDRFIRQGSSEAKSMKIRDIFKSAKSAMDFIDPNSLVVGSQYTLSKKTPIMADYRPSDLAR